MNEIILDCANLDSKAAFHAALKEALSLPEWYGGNLDAMHDCLTDIPSPTRLHLLNWHTLDDRLGDYAGKLMYVLHICSEENDNLLIELEG